MADPRFFRCSGPKSLKELSKIAQAEIIMPEQSSLTQDFKIQDIAPMDLAEENQLGFFNSAKYKESLRQSKASVCLTEEKLAKYVPDHMAILLAKVPQKAYALIAQAFYPDEANNTVELGYQAVPKSVKLGERVRLGAYVSLGENVEIGDGTVIGANTSIGAGTIIGRNCQIHANVNISHAIIGHGVKIYSGAQIGKPGFGFHIDQDGAISIPQIGRVIIQDMVEIGSNTCIDRGSGQDTVIGTMARIDNLVQIAHNVHIGAGTIVVAQVGISGSTKIGNFCAIGGQVGITGHLDIGNRVQIAARSGVMRDISNGEVVGGTPAVPIREWKRQVVAIQRIGSRKGL